MSSVSADTAHSLDSGHAGFILPPGITNKFTNKWPRPLSLGHLEARETGKETETSEATGVLEDGQGLGSSHVVRWTVFKWCLLFSITTVFAYGTAGLMCALMTWFRTWDKADVMGVADGDILILITLAGSLLLFAALVGITGALLNSRPILAVYTVLLWPAFVSMLTVGYVAYKRETFSLDHKLNLNWSRYYTPVGRLRVQDSLQCCGYYSPLHEISPSKRCYLRAPLPGCKGALYNFEHELLTKIWRAAFALVPLHLMNVVVALLCANHMTKTFGKGITPRQYRLHSDDVKADAERIFSGAEREGGFSSQYGQAKILSPD
ncbi:hypothetical protein B0H34DRAFT_782914 [Crassisporium funariophilum]|nr:hypothetical protein B0H34DRAFT_782914 [Crassisporium funariophilum]